MDLGVAFVEMSDDAVRFVPRRFARWRGAQPVTIPYADIEGLSMTEPEGLAHGRLTVRLADGGEDCSLWFGPFRTRDMQRVYAEMWRRTRDARADGPTADR